MTLVQAKKAQEFHESIGSTVHLNYPQYSNFAAVKQLLLDLGMKNIRHGSSLTAKMTELGQAGIKTLYLISPWVHKTVPNSSYATTNQDRSLASDKTLIVDRLKAIGTQYIKGLEMANELDLFCPNYRWSQADPSFVNKDSASPYFWAKYAYKITQDSRTAMKADPATANIPIIAPSQGGYQGYGFVTPLQNMESLIDFGNGHYYEEGGNGSQSAGAYIGFSNYYQDVVYPGVVSARISEEGNSTPNKVGYEPPFGNKPMYITECGYNTGDSLRAVSYALQAKLLTRMFVEYFRLGFAASYSYEFIDRSLYAEGVGDREDTFGIVRNDLTPKPAYVQLKALIDAVKESAPDTRSSVGSLDYTLNLAMPAGYTRTTYVRQVLLQKANGNFVLLVYHNVGSGDLRNGGKTEIINHPNINATLVLPSSYAIKNTTLGTTTTAPSSSTAVGSSYSFAINDNVTILELTPTTGTTPPPTTTPTYKLGSFGTNAYLDGRWLSDTELEIDAGGIDIEGTTDNGTMYYKDAVSTASNTITVRLLSILGGTATGARAGIMLRESLANNSKMLFVFATRDGSIKVDARTATGAVSATIATTANKMPEYLRVVRNGSTITVSVSGDGVNFGVLYTSTSFNFATSYLFGLAAASYNNAEKATAKFTNIAL